MELTDGAITLIGPDGGRTKLTSIRSRATFDGNNRPTKMELSFDVGNRPAGKPSVTASGTLEPATLRNGSLDVQLNNLSLEDLSPGLALFTRARNVTGKLDGTVSIKRTSNLSSSSDLKLQNTRLEGYGQPIEIPELAFNQSMSFAPDGSGKFSLELHSNDLLDVTAEGSAEQLLSSSGRLQATMSLSSNLRNMSKRIPQLLHLQTGWVLDGSFSAEGNMMVRMDGTDKFLQSIEGQFTLNGGGTSVRASGPDGKTVTLGNPSFNTDAGWKTVKQSDASEDGIPNQLQSVEVKKLSATFPGLDARLSGRLGDVSSSPRLEELATSLDARLEPLQEKLSPFTELGGYRLGGSIHMDLSGSGEKTIRTQGRLTSEELIVTDPEHRDIGPLNLTLQQQSTADLSEDRFRIDQVKLSGEEVAVELRNGQVVRPLKPDRSLETAWHVSGKLGTVTRKLSPLLAPYYRQMFRETEVTHLTGSVDMDGKEGTLRVNGDKDGLHVEASGGLRVSNLVLARADQEPIPLRDQLLTRIKKLSYKTGTSTASVDSFDLRTDGLSLDLSATGANLDPPFHVRQLNGEIEADPAKLQPFIDLYTRNRDRSAQGHMRANIEVTGKETSRGQMKANTRMQFEEIQVAGLENGSVGPLTGTLEGSGFSIDLRPNETSRFPGISLDSEVLTAEATATASDLGAGRPSATTAQMNGTITDPDRASNRYRALLAGYRLSGKPVDFDLRAKQTTNGFEVSDHTIHAPSLAVSGGALGTSGTSFSNLRSTGGFNYSRSALNVNGLSVTSDAGTISSNGTISTDPSGPSKVDLSASMSYSLAGLTPLFPNPDRYEGLTGQLNGEVSFDGTPNRMTVTSRLSGEDVSYKAEESGPALLDDEQIILTSNLQLQLFSEPRQVDLETFSVDGSIVRLKDESASVSFTSDQVTWSNWNANMSYHPRKVGDLMGPFLPENLTVTGEEWKTVQFQLSSGRATPGTLVDHMNGTGNYETGTVNWKGAEYRGGGDLRLDGGSAVITYDLSSEKEGKITGNTKFDLRSEAKLETPKNRVHRFQFDARNVRAREELSDLLQRIHPLFAGMGGTTEGTVDVSADLKLTGSLTEEDPMDRLSGPGQIHARNIEIRSGSFAGNVLKLIEKKQKWNVDIPQVAFRVDGRRIHHEKVEIQLSDHRLTSTGWVSLDGKYNIDLLIPVTDELIQEYKQLKSLRGTRLTLPVSGQGKNVSLDFETFLKNAFQKAGERQIRDQLEGLFN